MANMNLNVGGILGALAGVGIAVWLAFFSGYMDDARRPGRMIGFLALGGGIAGNFIWGLAFPKREEPPAEKTDGPS